MSRYQSVVLQLRSLDEVEAGLRDLGLPVERSALRLMLAGSLECAGEPVDLRLAAGVLQAVEDFGFVQDADGEIRLVCGELDAELLQVGLLAPLHAAIARRRLQTAGLRVDELTVDADGTRRVLLHED